MKEHNLFLHINSTNLPGYFGCACIKPAKYFENRIHDIQNIFDDAILLSDIRYSKDCDCSLEIVLTPDEKQNLTPVNIDNFFVFNNALPITRVRKVCFKNRDTKDKITALVNLSSGFLPDNIVDVIVKDSEIELTNIELPKGFVIMDLANDIRRFDGLMGAFALLRNAGEEYMNYSENYFSTLSRFNSIIEADLRKASKKLNEIFWDAFEGKKTFKSLYPYLYKDITSEDLNTIAEQEGQTIQRATLSGIIDINSLDRGTYIIAVLYTYGLGDEGRKNKIDGLILSNFKKDIRSDKSEVIALCYGLNRGYSSFSNSYKTSHTQKTIKFELNSRLDYYTIESLYQASFNHIDKSRDFPYLDWCPKYPKLKRRLKRSEYIVLDKVIFGEIQKIGSQKWWSGIMQVFFSKKGEELFMPLMQNVFEKIKSDFEAEAEEKLIEKDELIAELKSENSQLLVSGMQAELLQKEVERLRLELESLKTKNDYAKEDTSDYSSTEAHSKLQKKLLALEKLVTEISNQTSMKTTKELIKKFYSPDLDL